MKYKNVKELIKDLEPEELEIEDLIIHQRKDKKADKEIVKRMKECRVILEKHFDEEICLHCGLRFGDCPIKNQIRKNLSQEEKC